MVQKIIQMARNAQIAARLAGYKYAIRTILRSNIGLETIEKPFTKNDNLVIVAPHPDDDVLGCGGTMAKAINSGAKVFVVYITNGIHGTPDGKLDRKLAKIRRVEAVKALAAIGPVSTKFFNYNDGNFACSKQASTKIAQLINPLENVHIFTPWFFDEQPDHKEVTKTVSLALRQISSSKIKRIWQYEIWTAIVANRILPISDVLDNKLNAISAHKSQLKARDYSQAILGLNNYRGHIGNINGPAETFFVSTKKEFFKLFN